VKNKVDATESSAPPSVKCRNWYNVWQNSN